LDLQVKIKAWFLSSFLLVGLTILTGCSNEPQATIRAVEKTESQITISLFLEDPNQTVEQIDITVMDGTTTLAHAVNTNADGTLAGLWGITLPMINISEGTYDIVVAATLSNDDTKILTTTSVSWP
jgi:hypothetical protein